ncbi:winged helix-turn-helix transcriptional regulator [Streptomyces sp. NPDC051636]|uniref:winged helix-turn-helix transcriptional regulator n=1 Tax=Streptomyces sp. NPDC051636 TaxID=3365663 RepID=UPI0037A113CA
MSKTAEERRAEAKIAYNAFVETCPARQVLALIGEKWVALTINALAGGPRRHSELRSLITGASQKMLTQTLRTLERNGLVARTVTGLAPVRVDYELTELGHTLVPLLAALKQWSEGHIEEITAAREVFAEKARPTRVWDQPPRHPRARLSPTGNDRTGRRHDAGVAPVRRRSQNVGR